MSPHISQRQIKGVKLYQKPKECLQITARDQLLHVCMCGKPPVGHSKEKISSKTSEDCTLPAGCRGVCLVLSMCTFVSGNFVLCSSFICSTDDSLVAGVQPLQSAPLTFRFNALLTDTYKPHSRNKKQSERIAW